MARNDIAQLDNGSYRWYSPEGYFLNLQAKSMKKAEAEVQAHLAGSEPEQPVDEDPDEDPEADDESEGSEPEQPEEQPTEE